MTELPAELRQSLTYAIARGYYEDVFEEITPLIAAALARARAEGGREALTAAADELELLNALATTAAVKYRGEAIAVPVWQWLRMYAAQAAGIAPAERSGWEDHAPAEGCAQHHWIEDSREPELGFWCSVCGQDQPAAPSGVAPADTTEEPADG